MDIVPEAAPQPEDQEEILAAVLASLGEDEVPSEDDAWVITDSDWDRPAELAGLDAAELEELPAARAGAGIPVAAVPADRCESGPAGPLRDGPGSGLGFAEGGVLDGLAPGAALAGFAEDAHAGLAGLTDDELVGVLRAWRRQASWAQARELTATAELARRRPADDARPARPGEFPASLSEFTAEEVALALTLTRRSAGVQLDLALALASRRGTAAMLAAGQIDLPRARVIVDGITGLTEAHAGAVEAAVLPDAPGMTTGQLRAAVARAVLAADPDAARNDREERLKDARVECWTDPTGTASLAGRDLPSAETLAADQRLGQIARSWKKQLAAAWKQAGPDQAESRPAVGTDLLRARAYLALLLGQPVGCPPFDLLPLAGSRAPCSGPHSGPEGPEGPEGPDGPDGRESPDSLAPPGLRRCDPGPAAAGLLPLAGQVFLTLPLATLLGLSDAPGEAAGYGPVDPDTGRSLARAAAGHPVAGWHLIITDPHGRAIGYGHAPRAKPARGHPADGWTITLTTERIARGQSP